jgi:hypothetical protein
MAYGMTISQLAYLDVQADADLSHESRFLHLIDLSLVSHHFNLLSAPLLVLPI